MPMNIKSIKIFNIFENKKKIMLVKIPKMKNAEIHPFLQVLR